MIRTSKYNGHHNWMTLALEEASEAGKAGEIPVGAVVVDSEGVVVGRAGNRTESSYDASAHAELVALRQAAQTLKSSRLVGCTLYVTLEPCIMCAVGLSYFRICRLVFGAYDTKGGGVEHGPRIFSGAFGLHRPEVIGGVQETDSAVLLRQFFLKLRQAPCLDKE